MPSNEKRREAGQGVAALELSSGRFDHCAKIDSASRPFCVSTTCIVTG